MRLDPTGSLKMQLDQTHVVIRLRTLAEIGDLALVMIRRYPTAILVGFAAGAIPWAVANACILSWIPLRESSYGLYDEEASSNIWRYMYWMAVLVTLQTPAAGAFTTYYLGQAVFERAPTWSSVFKIVLSQSTKWIYVLGFKRLAIPAMIYAAWCWGRGPHFVNDFLVPSAFLAIVAIIRGGRPFMPEILLLENCPLRPKSEDVIGARNRSKSLHSVLSTDLSGRYLAVSFVVCFLFLSVMYTLIWFRGIIFGFWNWDLFTLLIVYPLALWLVAAASVFVRLLGYLDTRIRLEGWEVDLAVRAERIRQFGDEAPSVLSRQPNAVGHGNADSEIRSLPKPEVSVVGSQME